MGGAGQDSLPPKLNMKMANLKAIDKKISGADGKEIFEKKWNSKDEIRLLDEEIGWLEKKERVLCEKLLLVYTCIGMK